MDFPELATRTRTFSAGAPRAVTVSADGDRVVFLRSAGTQDPVDQLWVYDVPARAERLVFDPAGPVGIDGYATDPAGRIAAFTVAGRLFTADLRAREVTGHPTAGPARDPRPDPTGGKVGYLTDGTLRIRDLDAGGEDVLLAGEAGSNGVAWGGAEWMATREFGRDRGYWWSPDGRYVLAARVDTSRVPKITMFDPADPQAPARAQSLPLAGEANAQVTLHLLDLDGGWVDVHWDRETYPYLVSVSWTEAGGPLITVLRRLQQHGLVLAIDPRTGETQVHAELADPRWVSPVPGTPCHLPDGRVLIGGELAHDGYDARCLFADGTLLTPPALYVRRVCGRIPALTGGLDRPEFDLLVEASDTDPAEQHLFRVSAHAGSAGIDAQRLTTAPGWHTGAVGGDTVVVGTRSLDHAGIRWAVYLAGDRCGELRSHAAAPPTAPRPALERITDRRLPAAVLYPRAHVAGRRLPVLLDVDGAPGGQQVVADRAAWVVRQWWADAGFAVVVVDNRGTPGVAPSFEKVVHRRVADVVLADQVDGVQALAEKHPDLDLDRLAVRGWEFGGWLAALAVLRRPDMFGCGVAGTPIVDWHLAPTAYAERYLGLPADAADVYAHHGLLESAAEPPVRPGDARPLLILTDLADAAVLPAHALRLSAALLHAGRPHAVLPVTGAPRPMSLPAELDFVRRHLA
ncbi:prolyl oligopeptidase family serine peptidase [Luedemannella flava]|uniref:Prolyl oligopeptidase family serine peptidase n=1 Tax=Luedemannella flava TaxID=349316 RepID=A0ABP4YIF1_9ACTN